MANMVMVLSSLTLVGAAVVFSGALLPQKTTKNVAAVQSNSTNDSVWTLSNTSTNQACVIYKTQRISEQSFGLDVDQACENVMDGGSYALIWQESDTGIVSITDGRGYTFVEFSRSEDGGFTSAKGQSGEILLTPNS